MPVIPQGFAQVRFRLTLTGDLEEMINTIGLDVGAITTDQAWADAVSQAGADFYKTILGTSYRYEGADIAVGTATPGQPVLVESVTGAGAGTSSGSRLPQNCALLVKKNSASGGRHNRGRFFVPGISEADVGDNGALTSGALTFFQGEVNTFFTDLQVVSDNVVILHNDLTFPTPCTGFQVDGRIATQRRRLRR
jgi:hypothetical protein